MQPGIGKLQGKLILIRTLLLSNRFKECGVASLKIRCAKGLKCKVKTCDVALSSTGEQLAEKVRLSQLFTVDQ